MKNKRYNKRIFSGALQFAIYTAAIVALLLFGLILYLYTFLFFGQQLNVNNCNIKAINNGFATVLNENRVNGDTLSITNIEDSFQETKAISDYWGIFQITKIKTLNRTNRFEKIALIGSHFDSNTRSVLYLKDLFKPLAVVGDTKIEGTTLLSSQGVKPGNIQGNSYYGDQLIYGTIQRSSDQLPSLNTTFQKNINKLLTTAIPRKDDDFLIVDSNNRNSFFEDTKWYYSQDLISIQEEFTGNIIIKSDTLIRVTKQSKLKDVVLIAPNVIIEDNVKGIFQVVASKSIKVGKNVTLDYPSSLTLKKEHKDNNYENLLFIDEYAIVRGIICCFASNLSNNFAVDLFCNKNTVLLGEIYCEGNFELKGSVIGSVYTHQFISNTSGTLFVNHLYNAFLSSEMLPDYYSGLLFENQPKSVMKWLY